MRPFLFSAVTLLAACADAHPSEKIHLTFPVDCRLGETCVVQNFIDHDPGPGHRDHMCGALTYDGHDGTDIRLRTLSEMRKGVAVLAAADGRVLRTRDGVADISIRAPGAPDPDGRDCGNAVVIQHAGGYETQYCHLKRGSVRPLPGTVVKAGDRIGEIGLSGRTEFPHLHFTLRHNGKVVDPQAPDLTPGACARTAQGLWRNINASDLYQDVFPLAFGFADGPVTREQIDEGNTEHRRPDARSAMLVVYASVMGLRAGDVQVLSLIGPDGRILADNAQEPLASPKAAFWLMAGRRRQGEAWPPGRYTARYTLVRDELIVRDELTFIEF